jgi:predicted XRE-type DNA-binding protein
MNAIAAIPADTDSIPVKEGRISKRLQQVLVLLATRGMTQRDAANKVGMSESHLSHELKKPHIQVFIARKIRETVALGALRASTRLVELIDAGSEHVSADITKHTLAIAGIKPTADSQVSVNIDIKAGYCIDISPEPAMQIVGQNTGSKLIDG